MPLAPQDNAPDLLVSRPRLAPRGLLLAGAAAALLGVGLGLWARPTEIGRSLAAPAVAKPQPSHPTPRQIAIVVGDRTAPRGAPAADHPQRPPMAPTQAPTPAEPLAPTRSAAGLVKVEALAAPSAPEPKRPVRPRPPAARDGRPAPKKHPPAAHQAQHAAPPVRPRAPAAKPARAARPVKAKAPHRVAPGRRVAAAPPARPKAAPPRKPQIAAPPRSKPAPIRSAPSKAAGPLRVARMAPRCAASDPDAALVCADPALGAADRQMARTYRQAEAAGAPRARLERQQQRWLAARATAARKTPWAVHDVYLARIAELQDEIRRAQGPD